MQLLTRPKFAAWLRRLPHVTPEIRLSAPAMETLAVVAYRQPVLRADIEAVRGVGCGEILRQLMDRELVRVTGRSDELGRPYLYGTTRRFLQLFGLRCIEELPRTESFHPDAPSMERADRRSDLASPTSVEQNSVAKGGPQQERDSQVSITTEMDLRSPAVAGTESGESPFDGQTRPQVLDQWDEEEWDEEEDEDSDNDAEKKEDDDDFEYEYDDDDDQDDDWDDDEEFDEDYSEEEEELDEDGDLEEDDWQEVDDDDEEYDDEDFEEEDEEDEEDEDDDEEDEDEYDDDDDDYDDDDDDDWDDEEDDQ
jgi:segregation and condensation protein B